MLGSRVLLALEQYGREHRVPLDQALWARLPNSFSSSTFWPPFPPISS